MTRYFVRAKLDTAWRWMSQPEPAKYGEMPQIVWASSPFCASAFELEDILSMLKLLRISPYSCELIPDLPDLKEWVLAPSVDVDQPLSTPEQEALIRQHIEIQYTGGDPVFHLEINAKYCGAARRELKGWRVSHSKNMQVAYSPIDAFVLDPECRAAIDKALKGGSNEQN